MQAVARQSGSGPRVPHQGPTRLYDLLRSLLRIFRVLFVALSIRDKLFSIAMKISIEFEYIED